MSEENREEQELMGVGPDALLLRRDGTIWFADIDLAGRRLPHPWQSAIEAAEGPTPLDQSTKSDTGPLIDLLESDAVISQWDRMMLADLLRRHNPLSKPGRKKPTPIYRMSETETAFIFALAHYRLLLDEGRSEDDALVATHTKFGLGLDEFKNAVVRRRRSDQRTGRQTGKRAKKKP